MIMQGNQETSKIPSMEGCRASGGVVKMEGNDHAGKL